MGIPCPSQVEKGSGAIWPRRPETERYHHANLDDQERPPPPPQLESVEREPAFLFGYFREPEEGENATIIAASTSSHFGPFDTKDDEG
ncbi:hypothetical protein MYCTH_2122104 [Thermothelomyces thermophilus ATCC 42464]|uniref:Uncharacterized protein n=1 Tax=Thermothelomyces thermophilus (strain ATCC 42464 / BCRC 31852 / DSM 1799) TaxID=573729 RepID=G2Q0W6_THET4|nr:uncharacterized protein MYCTH_2122104 [Thermothelomyces thermophilus ATCC 42464]AEO53266.1 hypothetical protein MYCTH_2122104 [Thermothelomyces thermophilus ATCC 42464]